MSIRITCINKSGGYHEDPHHAISHLGWIADGTGNTGKSTRLEIYEWIKNIYRLKISVFLSQPGTG